MKIRLGLDLDGQHGDMPCNQLDALTTGPQGMLEVLETQLGLLRKEVGQAERVLQYHAVLSRLNSPSRFYHATFCADELGTAATLLNWRDQWYLHGLGEGPGKFLNSALSKRLRDMGEVESALNGKLAPCTGERLRLVANTLADITPRIESLNVLDPLSDWPVAWQTVLLRLSAVFDNERESSAAPSMLADLQAALYALRGGKQPARLKWYDDGSLRVVNAETQLLAGRWLGECLLGSRTTTLLVAPKPGLLDDLLAANHLPRQGFREYSAFRPALQVLPLAMGQLWNPLDIYGLLKFLNHPICPVPTFARKRLAEMLSASPGIGDGPVWERTLKEIEVACEKTGNDWVVIRNHISTWVENLRYNPIHGAPIEAILERVNLLTSYFFRRLKDADETQRNALRSGYAQVIACQRALQILARQGYNSITRQQLETLLSQATAQGVTNPMLRAEIGAVRSITHPAAAVEPVEKVIWWQLEAPHLPSSYPWSPDEISTLSEAGVKLPAVELLLDRESYAWQRPLMAATKQLTLVLPPPGSEEHPLWLLIKSIFDKNHLPPVLPLEACLTDPKLQSQPFRPLAKRKRWWTLPPGSLPKRQTESFSSLESFLFNPYQWVLTYPAALRPSSILDVSDGFLLYGTLAHHLVEQYVDRSDALLMSANAFNVWFDGAFERLVSSEGAILLMPGRSEDMTAFRRQLKHALQQLRQHFKSAGVIEVHAEHRFEGCFVGGEIAGYGDLLLTKADGSRAIVDMKWAGGKKYPAKLQENRHLQLAIYGELLRQNTGAWPQLAYFILSSGELIATDRAFFPECRVVWKNKDVGDEGASHLWNRFVKTWEWRRTQMDKGEVEVMIDMPEDTDIPEEGLKLELLNHSYNDYMALAGWKES